jgi:hypothetical protein
MTEAQDIKMTALLVVGILILFCLFMLLMIHICEKIHEGKYDKKPNENEILDNEEE